MIICSYKNIILFSLSSTLILLRQCIHANDSEFGRIISYDNFEHFKATLNKSYDHDYSEARSRKAYEENCHHIREHNEAAQRGHYSFEIRANNLADMTQAQYMKKYVRLRPSAVAKNDIPRIQNHEDAMLGSSQLFKREYGYDEEIPDSLDWRKLGFKTSAKNQKSCGSCYAFSIALSIEGQVFKRTGRLLELSEQQIVDCSTSVGNHGCGGGSLRNTLRYLASTRGIMRNVDYPYTSSQNKCDYRPELAVVNITDWAILPQRNEKAMKEAVAKVGPIAISINASPSTFQLYSHGIYDDVACTSTTVNHAMLVVGYTPEYWILKNWWGQNWGEGGYMKIRRHRNVCGLANYAAYAVV